MILIYISRSPKLFSVYDGKIETAFSLSAILDPIEGIFAPNLSKILLIFARFSDGNNSSLLNLYEKRKYFPECSFSAHFLH